MQRFRCGNRGVIRLIPSVIRADHHADFASNRLFVIEQAEVKVHRFAGFVMGLFAVGPAGNRVFPAAFPGGLFADGKRIDHECPRTALESGEKLKFHKIFRQLHLPRNLFPVVCSIELRAFHKIAFAVRSLIEETDFRAPVFVRGLLQVLRFDHRGENHRFPFEEGGVEVHGGRIAFRFIIVELQACGTAGSAFEIPVGGVTAELPQFRFRIQIVLPERVGGRHCAAQHEQRRKKRPSDHFALFSLLRFKAFRITCLRGVSGAGFISRREEPACSTLHSRASR